MLTVAATSGPSPRRLAHAIWHGSPGLLGAFPRRGSPAGAVAGCFSWGSPPRGFFAVFGTTLHHNFFVMLAGFVFFAAAVIFRLRTEPLFERATAAGLWPLPHSAIPPAKDTHHA